MNLMKSANGFDDTSQLAEVSHCFFSLLASIIFLDPGYTQRGEAATNILEPRINPVR